MPAQTEAWWDDLRQEAELPPEPPARSKAPVILGALAAVAISAGAAWWLSRPGEAPAVDPVLQVQPAPERARFAGASADPEQVRRAYEEFGIVYANSGAEGLARFSTSCEQSLRGDARILDFCLAFDMFADAVNAAPGAEVAGKAEARRVAFVQRALPPGADPDSRIEAVRRLMRDVSGVAALPPPPPEALPAAPAGSPPASEPVRLAKAAPVRRPAAGTASGACRLQPTPADRLICANAALRNQDRQMKMAYERALAAGASPLEVDRAQAEWRAMRNAADSRGELSSLYAQRIRELNIAAENARRQPQSPPAPPAPEEPIS